MTEPYPSYFGFEDLEVYELSLEFIAEVYRLSQSFLRAEQFGFLAKASRIKGKLNALAGALDSA
ncbi:four helix bundle protein [Calidithermus timidus]|jgi:hypothetical protein|uniref:four helix bundle protein n=1 Tax=Calidithermus timidus TaxID=307124 RepID=UPI00036A3535|nr:four helix bundle protein [Calidithermus timidus]